MNNFNEENTVEELVRDLLCGKQSSSKAFAEPVPIYQTGRSSRGIGWQYVPAIALPRQPQDVFVEAYVREALIRLNPTIAVQPERADEVLYKLRAIVLAVRGEGLIRANELFTAWLRNEQSMPFGRNHQHVTVKLIDFDNLDNNQYLLTTQYTFRAGASERRADVVLLVNGFPLVLVEAKTPVRNAISWVDGALQVHIDYERFVPELFACNVFSAATEGKEMRYGAIRMPIELWGPWRMDDDQTSEVFGNLGGLKDVGRQIQSLLRPQVVLDILANFTLFATDKRTAASKSSAATSSTMPPTRLCSASWPGGRAKG
jgi:type I restriction enzyme R subunit